MTRLYKLLFILIMINGLLGHVTFRRGGGYYRHKFKKSTNHFRHFKPLPPMVPFPMYSFPTIPSPFHRFHEPSFPHLYSDYKRQLYRMAKTLMPVKPTHSRYLPFHHNFPAFHHFQNSPDFYGKPNSFHKNGKFQNFVNPYSMKTFRDHSMYSVNKPYTFEPFNLYGNSRLQESLTHVYDGFPSVSSGKKEVNMSPFGTQQLVTKGQMNDLHDISKMDVHKPLVRDRLFVLSKKANDALFINSPFALRQKTDFHFKDFNGDTYKGNTVSDGIGETKNVLTSEKNVSGDPNYTIRGGNYLIGTARDVVGDAIGTILGHNDVASSGNGVIVGYNDVTSTGNGVFVGHNDVISSGNDVIGGGNDKLFSDHTLIDSPGAVNEFIDEVVNNVGELSGKMTVEINTGDGTNVVLDLTQPVVTMGDITAELKSGTPQGPFDGNINTLDVSKTGSLHDLNVKNNDGVPIRINLFNEVTDTTLTDKNINDHHHHDHNHDHHHHHHHHLDKANLINRVEAQTNGVQLTLGTARPDDSGRERIVSAVSKENPFSEPMDDMGAFGPGPYYTCHPPSRVICGAKFDWYHVIGMVEWCKRNCIVDNYSSYCDDERCSCQCV